MWGEILNLSNPLIAKDNTWMLWTVCVGFAALAIILEQKYEWASKLTGAILALIFAVLLSNLGIVPMDAPTWDVVWGYVVPLAIPLLLFNCDMKKIGKESGRLLLMFLLSSAGTAFGAVFAFILLKGHIKELAGLAGVFTGTYIGGTVNFVALGNSFDISKDMISAATVADNLLMVVYFFILISMPALAFFKNKFKHPYVDEVERAGHNKEKGKTGVANFWGRKEISLKDIALSVAMGFIIVTVAGIVSDIFKSIIPTGGSVSNILNILLGNKYLWITTVSMLFATLMPKFMGNIKGASEIGTFLIYIFFFVIGVPASLSAIVKNSPLLFVFAGIIILVNMLVSLTLGKLFGFTLEEIIISSNANIGGPTTAAAMAVSKGWTKLIAPAMLVGTLGYIIGTYLGILVGGVLGA